jgi:hypothetical protein
LPRMPRIMVCSCSSFLSCRSPHRNQA